MPLTTTVLCHLTACKALPTLRELTLPADAGTLTLLRHSTLRTDSLALTWPYVLRGLPPAALASLTELQLPVEWVSDNAAILGGLTRLRQLEVYVF